MPEVEAVAVLAVEVELLTGCGPGTYERTVGGAPSAWTQEVVSPISSTSTTRNPAITSNSIMPCGVAEALPFVQFLGGMKWKFPKQKERSRRPTRS